MNAGSLFSGIGGMDHGLARAGFHHVFFCESDPWRRGVLEHHWPGVPVYSDVAGVGVERPAAEPLSAGEQQLERVDLLAGGFPCQDLSVAGQRRGLAGERSSLFFEFARIIKSLQPRWVLIENVPGLLSSNDGRDFGIVLGTLADIGYGVGYRVLDSRYFGVPQRRRRVFILGAESVGDPRAAAERAGQVLAVGTRCPGHPLSGRKAREDVAVASLSGLGNGGPDDNDGQGGRLVAPALVKHYGKGADSDATDTLVTSITMASDPISAVGLAQPATRRHGDPGVIQSATQGVRRLTPVECERLQALPDNWTDHGPDSRRYAALGDAVTSSVAEWIGRRILAVAA